MALWYSSLISNCRLGFSADSSFPVKAALQHSLVGISLQRPLRLPFTQAEHHGKLCLQPVISHHGHTIPTQTKCPSQAPIATFGYFFGEDLYETPANIDRAKQFVLSESIPVHQIDPDQSSARIFWLILILPFKNKALVPHRAVCIPPHNRSELHKTSVHIF